MVLRDRDAAADGTYEERRYVLQNWRADVACTIEDDGEVIEWVRYTPYGVAYSIPWVNADRNGDDGIDDLDDTDFANDFANEHPSADLNRNGEWDSGDIALWNAAFSGGIKAEWALAPQTGLRFGYAGYAHDGSVDMYHVRHRVYRQDLGRWLTRDPARMPWWNTYCYTECDPVTQSDSNGLCSTKIPPSPYALYTRDHLTNAGGTSNEIPQYIPSNTPPGFLPAIVNRCSRYTYPIDIQHCTDWEKARVIRNHWHLAGDLLTCKTYAESVSAKYYSDESDCRNNLRHCVFSACLHENAQWWPGFEREDAWDILWAHECCLIHMQRENVDWNDFRRDTAWNVVGHNCAYDDGIIGYDGLEELLKCCLKSLRRTNPNCAALPR